MSWASRLAVELSRTHTRPGGPPCTVTPPLTPEGRFRLCQRIGDGWTVATAAESMHISCQTAHKWWRRYQESGVAGLEDRSSRLRRCPTRTPARLERASWRSGGVTSSVQLARLAGGVPASSPHRVLRRHGVSWLSDLDRGSGRVIRRIETSRPGELVHIDVKKQAKIPRGGGWWVVGGGWWVEGGGWTFGRDRCTTPKAGDPAWVTPTSIRRRRLQPFGIFRGPRGRAGGYGYRVLASCPSLLRELWRVRRKGAHGQRGLISLGGIRNRPPRCLRPALSIRGGSNHGSLDRWLHLFNHHRHHYAVDGPPVSGVNNLIGQNS